MNKFLKIFGVLIALLPIIFIFLACLVFGALQIIVTKDGRKRIQEWSITHNNPEEDI